MESCWLFQSFQPLFCRVLRVLGTGVVLSVYQLGLGTPPPPLVLCLLITCGVFGNGLRLLQREVLRGESYAYLWVCAYKIWEPLAEPPDRPVTLVCGFLSPQRSSVYQMKLERVEQTDSHPRTPASGQLFIYIGILPPSLPDQYFMHLSTQKLQHVSRQGSGHCSFEISQTGLCTACAFW